MTTALLIRDDIARDLTIAPEFTLAKDVALQNAALIGAVRNQESQAEAVKVQAELKSLISGVERARKEVKQPVLDFGRLIDERARQAVLELEAEHLRVTNLVCTYADEQRQIAADLERRRQAELAAVEAENRRKQYEAEKAAREAQEAAEREQKRIADEAARVEREAQEAAEREQKRLADEVAKERNAARRAEIEAAAAATAKKAKAEAEKRKSELEAASAAAAEKAKADAAAAQVEQERIAAEARRSVEDCGPAVVAQVAKGQVVGTDLDVIVTDVHALYRVQPNCVELKPRIAELKELYRMGHKDIKGVRFEVKTTSTTRTQAKRFIEV
jgi:DNA polymerase III gamma/tau subunit